MGCSVTAQAVKRTVRRKLINFIQKYFPYKESKNSVLTKCFMASSTQHIPNKLPQMKKIYQLVITVHVQLYIAMNHSY